jgi:hypothetical protein
VALQLFREAHPPLIAVARVGKMRPLTPEQVGVGGLTLSTIDSDGGDGADGIIIVWEYK